MFGELLPLVMMTMFVDDAADLVLTAPALEGGLILHLPTPSPNVLRAKGDELAQMIHLRG
jgi:hypothetical protein